MSYVGSRSSASTDIDSAVADPAVTDPAAAHPVGQFDALSLLVFNDEQQTNAEKAIYAGESGNATSLYSLLKKTTKVPNLKRPPLKVSPARPKRDLTSSRETTAKYQSSIALLPGRSKLRDSWM